MAIILQLLRVGAGAGAALLIAQGLALSFDGKGHASTTYLALYGGGALLALSCVALWVVIHRRTRKEREEPALLEPTVNSTLDGNEDLRVALRPDHPQAVLLEYEVANPNPATNIPGVSVNAWITEGLNPEKADRAGRAGETGDWTKERQPFGDEEPPGALRDCWMHRHETLDGGGKLYFPFKLRLARSGTFDIALELFGNVAPLWTHGSIEVAEAEDPGPRGAIGEVIYRGEELLERRPDAFTDDSPPSEWGGWLIDAAKAVPEGDLLDYYQEQQAKGVQAGPEYWKAELEAKLRALYEVRRRLG